LPAGAAYADDGSDNSSYPGCPPGCNSFGGGNMCLCLSPARYQSGQVYGSAKVINFGRSWAQSEGPERRRLQAAAQSLRLLEAWANLSAWQT
jgi:hypothetical protein